MKFLTSHSPAWICLLFACQLFSQKSTVIKVNEQDLIPLSKVAQAVKDAKNSGIPFQNIQALALSKKDELSTRTKYNDKAVVLDADKVVLRNLLKDNPKQISLTIPKNDRENIKLSLIKVNPLAEGFNVFTSTDQKIPFNYLPGVYYRGVVEGNENNSVAAISFFVDEVIGSFTYEGGNIMIQPSYSSSGELVMFNDKDKPEGFHFECYADQLEKIKKPIQPRGLTTSGDCVRVYIECDYALYQNKSGTTSTINWITSVFNNIATLYANESINTTISEVFVWTTADSYSKTSSIDALNQFKAARPTFNGDIAHLAALGGSNLGGVAWVDVLCSSYKYAYSNISSSYSSAPTYSWTVEVMTHEMGHSLGSNHTQWCGWNGGALDNCYTTEGGCPAGPAPTNGGTIMSYCHLTSYGINFNNGFGQQPGDRIRTQVAAATCLNSSCSGGGGGGGCNTPSGLAISNITQTSATASWSSVSGATSYSFEYKLNSGSTWTTLSTSSTNSNLTGLTANSLYNTRVKAICSSGSSAYATTVNFTTGTGGSCGIPTNFIASNITTSTAIVSWNAVSGASSYNFQYKLASGNTWTQVNLASTSVSMTGMSPGVSYSVRVQTLCGSGQSDFGSIVTFTTQLGYCISKGQNTNYEWIKRVNLGAIDRVSAGDGGYFNATNLVANLLKGSTYTINYQCGSTGNSGILYWKIWIDFNNNNSFEDANELIVSNATSNTGLLSTSFTVPADATTANVRMRVAMKYGGFPTSCLTFSYGEVEEYTINIQSAGGDDCHKPSELNITNITKNSSTANWIAGSGANSYSLEYKVNSESNWNVINTSATTYNLTGLISGTLYNTRVKSICTSGTSDYAPVINFTTENEVCDTPTNLAVSAITKTTATANWNVATGAATYSFEYKPNSGSSWTAINKSTTSHNLTGLTAGTQYNTRVKTNCSSGSSEYSSIINFTTQNETCDAPTTLNPSNITQNAATVTWNLVAAASSYSLEYKPNSGSTWTIINTSSMVYNLSGLSPNTLYDVHVKSICSFGSSDYSISVHFTTSAEESCGIPINLSAGSLGQSTASISWNSVNGANAYNVQYKLASSSTWTNINVTTALVNLSGLTPTTSYNVRVQSICGPNQSAYSSILSFSTLGDYCVSKGQSSNYEWIKRVKLGSIDRTSSKDGGYYNGTSLSTNVTKGGNYTINYQCGSTGSSGTLYWRVWIDFNNNNSFEDPGEMVVSFASSSLELLSSNFTVPSGAATANVRMRVSLKYSGYSTSCLTYTYGEVEDYTVNIQSTGGLVDPNAAKEQLENVKLYPNPFTKDFNLDFYANMDQEVQIILMDQLGKIYLSKPLHAWSGNNTFHIETSEFIPATYLIQIKTASNTYFRKIAKLE